jgi:peptide/nickel transport system substrate-binding protein
LLTEEKLAYKGSNEHSIGFDRRRFMGSVVATGAAAAIGLPAFAQTPRRGGHLIMGLDGSSSGESIDPGWGAGTYIHVVKALIYDNLIEVDERLALKPWLAESWEGSDRAKNWVIKLRKGATFHNGKEVTAEDVVYSINHHRKPDSKSPAKALLAVIQEIKPTGPHELSIRLQSGEVDLPYILAEYRLAICPNGTTFTDGVGSGPYVLESFEPGVRARLKRRSNDWRSDRGYVDSIEVIAMNDTTARMSALQSGAIHFANHVDPRAVAQLEQNPQIQVYSVPGGAHYTFPMRCDTAPYSSNDMRLALKYAIDREALLRTVLRGHGKIGNDQPVAATDPNYAPDLPRHTYDPDKAKFHFQKSGNSGPLVLTVAEIAFPGAVEAAQIFQASAAKSGITIELDRVPNDGWFANVWRTKPFVPCYWGGRPTPGLQFSIVYKSDAPWNDAKWKRPDFDQLLAASKEELDVAKRKQMYQDMQRMIVEDGGQIVPVFNNVIDAGSKKVRNFIAAPSYEMGGFKGPTRVWLDG